MPVSVWLRISGLSGVGVGAGVAVGCGVGAVVGEGVGVGVGGGVGVAVGVGVGVIVGSGVFLSMWPDELIVLTVFGSAYPVGVRHASRIIITAKTAKIAV